MSRSFHRDGAARLAEDGEVKKASAAGGLRLQLQRERKGVGKAIEKRA